MKLYAVVLLISTALAGEIAAQAQVPSTTETAEKGEQIRQAVQQLGAPSFSLRQEASDFLWRAGPAAAPALEEVLESRDAEVVFRARQILDRFRLGIFVDTPPQVVRLIETYREGDLAVKRVVLQQLRERGAVKSMVTLLRAESNEATRDQLAREFSRDVETIIPDLIVAGELEDALDLIELAAASTDEGMRHLAVLLLLTKQLDSRIEKERAELAKEGESVKPTAAETSQLKRRLLTYLLRAAGKWEEAATVADKLDDRFAFMGEALSYEMRNWRSLAKRYDESRAKDATQDDSIEFVGYSLAYHRLSGDAAGVARDVAQVKNLAGSSDDNVWYCAEALLVNGMFDEGIELLRASRPEAAFRLLAAQMRYREAFELVKLDPANSEDWFRELCRDIRSSDDELRGRLSLGLAVARVLVRLGERQRAIDGLALIGEALGQDDDGRRLATLCEAERKMGLRSQAFDHAAEALAKGPDGVALGQLFDDQRDTADVWWRFFRDRHEGEPHRATLERVAEMLKFVRPSGAEDAPMEKAADVDWLALVDQAADTAKQAEEAQRNQWLQALAETCLLRGDRDRAKQLLATGESVSSAATMRLADLYAEDEDWKQAAEWYGRAADDSDQRSLALFLQGHALEKSGDKQEAQRLKDLAEMLPLAEAARRRTLADGLKERGLIEDAIRQWKLILRTTAFRDWYSSNASMNLGNALSGKDHLAAADHWEALSLSVLKTSSSFIEVEGYLQLPHLVHKSRARGMLAGGNNESAIANLWISQRAYPGNIDLAEDLIPELETAGLKSVADELFDKVYQPNEQVCVDYPNNASAQNNVAWLAARSGRRLGEALAHARRAVELEPENAAYLDTLAEALYRTGGRREAIELEQRCLEQDPENDHFQRQLARFKSGQ